MGKGSAGSAEDVPGRGDWEVACDKALAIRVSAGILSLTQFLFTVPILK
eukprot:CAMPEP_0202971994 /NCGR_PEP_ID=MMETSP1396-20130829/32396_1 /ASSEMBLY_ACC=CAM_ASM_000872 /TAXON_ID= /ORGANISM="Pseudokeronopsis sp., Strain Brazil" /LENGTH=48 /DNA_ID= /DNA_START= /DNA_END= /DNA_ORIENTATION=